MNRLRVGVIGVGAFAEACHIPGLQSHPQADVVMICGRSRERTSALAARFAIASITLDPTELCQSDELDAVTICTPTHTHAALAILALRHGKHVFCEKPLALSAVEAAEMARVARASGVIHQVGFTFRHLFGVRELKRRVEEGAVGEPIFLHMRHEYFDGLQSGLPVGWQHHRATAGGGVLRDTGAHLFDLARFILGPIGAVRAEVLESVRPGVETDDIASVGLRLAGGVPGHCLASRITPARSPNFVQVVGREGVMEALISRGALDALRRSRGSAWEDVALPADAADGRPHALGLMMRSFVDACLQRRLCSGAASFDDGLCAQWAMEAAERASSGGNWVRVPTG